MNPSLLISYKSKAKSNFSFISLLYSDYLSSKIKQKKKAKPNLPLTCCRKS